MIDINASNEHTVSAPTKKARALITPSKEVVKEVLSNPNDEIFLHRKMYTRSTAQSLQFKDSPQMDLSFIMPPEPSELCIVKNRGMLSRLWFEDAILLQPKTKALLIIESKSSLFMQILRWGKGNINFHQNYCHFIQLNMGEKQRQFYMQIPVMILSHGGNKIVSQTNTINEKKLFVKQGEGLNTVWTGNIPKYFDSTGYLLKWNTFHDNKVMLYANNSNHSFCLFFFFLTRHFICSNIILKFSI